MEHHLGGGKAAFDFVPDRIRTLWFPLQHIAPIDYNGGNIVTILVSSCVDCTFFILSGIEDNHNIADRNINNNRICI